MSRYERGDNRLFAAELANVAAALNVNVAFLVGEDAPRHGGELAPELFTAPEAGPLLAAYAAMPPPARGPLATLVTAAARHAELRRPQPAAVGYRLFILDPTGNVASVEELDCVDHQAAIEATAARYESDGRAMELWDFEERLLTVRSKPARRN